MESVGIVPPGQNIFRGRPVLVTGHTGFKGAWLCVWLNELGAEVTGYSLAPPTNPSLFKLLRLRDAVNNIHGDIRNYKAMLRAIKETRPGFIFHLAAQSLVRSSYQAPLDTFETNVLGTANILEAVRESGHPCNIVAVTTDKCYENREKTSGYRETEPLGGSDPYSASKGCAELVAACWRKSFFTGNGKVRLATARAGNVIGGGDWARDRIVPDCIRALCVGKAVAVRNPHAIRPWQHVLDPLHGYLMLASRMSGRDGGKFCSAWNFGPHGRNNRTVGRLVDEVFIQWGKGAWRAMPDRSLPDETGILALDCRKARQDLGWTPRWGFQKTVAETIKWYKAWHEGRDDLLDLCVSQIRAFNDEANHSVTTKHAKAGSIVSRVLRIS